MYPTRQGPSYPGYSHIRPLSQLHGTSAPPPLHIPSATPPQHQYSHFGPMPSNLPPRQQPPPSPSEQSDKMTEEEMQNLPGPKPTSSMWGGYVWALEIVQNPSRARMCGFGDKDRRPISPPPCIRLVIMDPNTQTEVDYNEIDLTHLVLIVDIWDYGAQRELNLVKQSNASPCISSAATGAYPATVGQPPLPHEPPRPYDVGSIPSYNRQTWTPPSATPPATSPFYPQGPRPPYMNGQNGYASPFANGSAPYPPPGYGYPPSGTPQMSHPNQLPAMGSAIHGYQANQPPAVQVYTRNLIGSLAASAFRLKDEKDKLGIWFVLQDLSVRTEGWFRLKMSFFNLSEAVREQIQASINGTSNGETSSGGTRHPEPGSQSQKDPAQWAPCLASIFSAPFKVYSAKKFPGVVESTPLSKAFANQGIKIPIRKDTGGKRGREDSEDDEDSAEG